MSFAEFLVTQRRINDLDKMSRLVRWDRFHYRLKKLLNRSPEGRPAYDELAMFSVTINHKDLIQKNQDFLDLSWEEIATLFCNSFAYRCQVSF